MTACGGSRYAAAVAQAHRIDVMRISGGAA